MKVPTGYFIEISDEIFNQYKDSLVCLLKKGIKIHGKTSKL